MLAKKLILVILLPFIFASTVYGDISFRKYSLEKAKGVAKIENRNILVSYSADWCLPCKLLEGGAFRDKRLTSMMNKKFINVKAHYENHEEKEWFEEYEVEDLPMILIINQEGEKIFEINGLMTASILYKSFEQFQDGLQPKNLIDFQQQYIVENNITNVNDVIQKRNVESIEEPIAEKLDQKPIQVLLQFGRYKSFRKANSNRKKLLEKNISTIILEQIEGGKLRYLLVTDELLEYNMACDMFGKYAEKDIYCSLKFPNSQMDIDNSVN